MTYLIDIQNACINPLPIDKATLRIIAKNALALHPTNSAEITLRFVESEEMLHLNSTYRHINKTTNVLAFPASMQVATKRPFLGDVIICTEVLKTECVQLNRPFKDYLAHITTHGILHLIGYDHIEEEDSKIMQTHEINLLTTQGYAHPYPIMDDAQDER